MAHNVTIDQLAELMKKKVWEKGNLRRIYMNDAGHNTKKMRTSAYIYQDEDGSFRISVFIDCPSQSMEWINSQKRLVVKEIEYLIESALNPDKHADNEEE